MLSEGDLAAVCWRNGDTLSAIKLCASFYPEAGFCAYEEVQPGGGTFPVDFLPNRPKLQVGGGANRGDAWVFARALSLQLLSSH